MYPDPAGKPDPDALEWFARPDSPEHGQGLRFSCTMCGNCCSGPSGFVLLNDDETRGLADHLGLTEEEFIGRDTHMLPIGRSLIEKPAPEGANASRGGGGYDCVFLDRTTIPGKAVCGVYNHRPRQCRTWPFWNSTLHSPGAWHRASRTCPGIDKGPLHSLVQIRISRGVVDI